METAIKFKLQDAIHSKQPILFLVGAGLSAESGIPTFRGSDGYWTVGSENYTPQEMGTLEMFKKYPIAVWKWYWHRMKICAKAKPNKSHKLLVEFEKLLSNQFALISQNVDGLHKQAGSSDERLYLIHGDLNYMRCSKDCCETLFELPFDSTKDIEVVKSDLICPNCGHMARPHVLWFDETYNEVYYHQDTVVNLALNAAALFIVGTSGATLLPWVIHDAVQKNGGLIVNIDPNENRFSKRISMNSNGYNLKYKSSEALAVMYEVIR